MRHRLLARQLKRLGIDGTTPPDHMQWLRLLELVSTAYGALDKKRIQTKPLLDQLRLASSHLIEQASRNAKLQAVLNAAPGPISWVSSDLKYLGVNEVLANMHGKEPADFIGQDVGFITGNSSFRKTIAALFASPKNQMSWELQFTAQGTLQWSLLVGQKYNDGREAVIVGYDISDRVMAELSLAENEEKFRSTFNQAAVGIVNITAEFICFQANQKFADIVGLPSQDTVGLNFQDVIFAGDADVFRNAIERLVSEERESVTLELRVTPAVVVSDAAELPFVWTKLTASLVRSDTGELKYFIFVIEDITSQRKAENELLQSRQALVHTERLAALGEMAAGIAHEINNPLAIIMGRCEQMKGLLEDGNPTPDALKRVAANISSTAARIGKIVKGLRSFSRDAERDPMEQANVRSLVDDTLELCSERFSANGIELRVESPAKPLSMQCRPTQVSQVLLNLLANAHDAVEKRDERWVSVSIREQDAFIEIWITDSGPGIPLDIRQKILMPFFTTKEVGKGTGLGLSISKGIIEAHGGSLYLDETSPNTRFVIRLPKTQAARVPMKHSA